MKRNEIDAFDVADKKAKERVEGKTRKKGLGYFGRLQRPDGRVSTELSMGVMEDWTDMKETEIPTLVPTLTLGEINHLLSGKEPTVEIEQKARKHAQMRIKKGLSPFAQDREQQDISKKMPLITWK